MIDIDIGTKRKVLSTKIYLHVGTLHGNEGICGAMKRQDSTRKLPG